MPFDPTKPCTTRDGRKVRILTTDLNNKQPIAGVVTDRDGEEALESFFPDGGFLFSRTSSNWDLVNVPEKVVGWINVYKTQPGRYDVGNLNLSLEAAEKCRQSNTVACVKIEFEVK